MAQKHAGDLPKGIRTAPLCLPAVSCGIARLPLPPVFPVSPFFPPHDRKGTSKCSFSPRAMNRACTHAKGGIRSYVVPHAKGGFTVNFNVSHPGHPRHIQVDTPRVLRGDQTALFEKTRTTFAPSPPFPRLDLDFGKDESFPRQPENSENQDPDGGTGVRARKWLGSRKTHLSQSAAPKGGTGARARKWFGFFTKNDQISQRTPGV